MAQTIGLDNIKRLIDDAYADWGYNAPPAGEKERFADMSGIESAYGKANFESGNGLVFGTWQVAASLAPTMLDRLANNNYSSTIPADVQTEMAKEYREILARAGSHQAALQDQRGGLIMAKAIQADNNNTLQGSGIDGLAVEDAFPEHKFALSYVKHQLPPNEVKAIYAELEAVQKGEKTMEQALATDIDSLIPKNIQASNPSTYNKQVENLGQVRVENLGDFLALLDSKQQLEVEATAAQTGVTMPTSGTLDYVINDVKAYDAKLAAQLRSVQPLFDARTDDPAEQQHIADAFNALSELTKNLYKEHGIIYDEQSSLIATHIGAYSAATLLKAGDAENIADVAGKHKDGQVFMQNVTDYVAQLQAEGITSDKDASNMTVGDVKSLAAEHLALVKQESKQAVKERQNGTQSQQEDKEFDFFASMQEAMGPEFGAIVGFIVSIASLIGSMFGFGEGQAQDAEEVTAQNTPSNAKAQASPAK
jgi:hypothetical protein